MYKVHRLVERRTTLNSRKWENNKTFENIKQAAYEYFTSVSIISKCIKNNKPFRGIIYWKRI